MKAMFHFLFRWSFLLPKWNCLIPLLSIKLIPFCLQKFFKRAFVSVRVFWMFVLSLRLMIDENAIDVDGNSLETLLKIFLTLVKRFTLLVISLVPTWTTRSSGFSLIITSSFSRIFSLVPPGKFTIFTLWLTLRPFSEIPFYHGVSGQYDFLLTRKFCLSFYFLELELGLEFPLSVSTISSFSVTVSFTELVLLLVSFFCFRRTFMIAYFSISSFSRLNMLFFKISNSNYHYYYKLFFPEMFWSAISSSSNFRSVNFVNRFISSTSFRFEMKLNYAYIRLMDISQVSLALVVEQMEVLECLSFFVKKIILGILGILEKLKSLIQTTGHIDSWVQLESLQPIYVL